MTVHYSPRLAQKKILAYRGGTMGISAVPGSGKTWTLSLLTAELIKSGIMSVDQEVLVVTLVNSAVDNFSQRISSFLQDMGLLPSLGYRVRTLHGLAHDIVKERPDLVGLDSKFQIIDEREADRIKVDARLFLSGTGYPGYICLKEYIFPLIKSPFLSKTTSKTGAIPFSFFIDIIPYVQKLPREYAISLPL